MPSTKLSATVNTQFNFSAEALREANLVPLADGQFHILHQDRSYRAELLDANYQAKSFTIKINGSRYTVKLADEFDHMVERLGLNIVKQQVVKDVKAPMPGMVLDILVKVGETVTEGTSLLILEAMKMENVIKATADGEVGTIEVTKGQAVDKGQLLLRMA